MDKIIIQGILSEELTSEDYNRLYDFLMQLGVEDIDVEVTHE